MSLSQYFKRWRLAGHAKALQKRCRSLESIDAMVGEVLRHKKFSAAQKSSELADCLRRVASLRPRVLCEIGSAKGGTLALFCRVAAPDARVVSIDLNYDPIRQVAHQYLAGPGRHVTTYRGDSHHERTVAFVKQWLGGDRLDFLFIDGDHSYAGVSADYALYEPLVRPGGLIGFHDIVPDFRMRYGKPTAADVGDVPRFWQELKLQVFETEELIENQGQDGMGIGLVFKELT